MTDTQTTQRTAKERLEAMLTYPNGKSFVPDYELRESKFDAEKAARSRVNLQWNMKDLRETLDSKDTIGIPSARAQLHNSFLQYIRDIALEGNSSQRAEELELFRSITAHEDIQNIIDNYSSLGKYFESLYNLHSKATEDKDNPFMLHILANFDAKRSLSSSGGQPIGKIVENRIALGKLGLVPQFDERELEDAVHWIREDIKLLVREGIDGVHRYFSNEKKPFGADISLLYLSLTDICPRAGIPVQELGIDVEKLRKTMVAWIPKYSESFPESDKAIQKLDAYLGTGEAK